MFAIVYNWVHRFKRGPTSTKDEHRLGRPVEVTTPEMIDKIHHTFLSDRLIKMHKIVEATVFSISHKKLGVEKILIRWVPRLLSEKNKRNRVLDSEAILAIFRRNPARKRNLAVCSLATVASRAQSVRASNCHILEGALLHREKFLVTVT